MRRRFLLCTFLAAPTLWPPAATYGTQRQPPPATSSPSRTADDSSQRRAGTQSRAEDLLRELQRSRPVQEVIPPLSASERRDRSKPALLPEGWVVVDLRGRLRESNRPWSFTFEPESDHPAVTLLPCANLEVMVRTARGSDHPVTFIVSGEMTVFDDENFLLVRGVRRAAVGSATTQVSTPKRGAAANPDGEAQSAAAAGAPDVSDARHPSDEAPSTSGPPPFEPAAVEDVLTRMRQQRPRESILPLDPAPGGDASVPASGMRELLPEGVSIVRRAGRVVQEGAWWAFVFEADHPAHPEPPMRLLPCRTTQQMVGAWQSESAGLVHVVSGEVTLFEGRNYLLPRFALRRADDGNLRK